MLQASSRAKPARMVDASIMVDHVSQCTARHAGGSSSRQSAQHQPLDAAVRSEWREPLSQESHGSMQSGWHQR